VGLIQVFLLYTKIPVLASQEFCRVQGLDKISDFGRVELESEKYGTVVDVFQFSNALP
jgi:hypothetical protein